MTSRLRAAFAELSRTTRNELDITQAALAHAANISRAHVASIETQRANPTLDLVERMSDALGVELDFLSRRPTVPEPRQRDLVHARCSAYAQRRLQALGFICLREVEIVEGRSHGWIDLVAFDPSTGSLLVIEIKTSLLDVGAVERQLGWYERRATDVARQRGWDVSRLRGWLLCLASGEVDETVRLNRDALRMAFPVRARTLRDQLGGAIAVDTGRGLALIDPSRRRRDWLLPSRADGRRSAAPYRNYADAVARWRVEARRPGRRA